MTDSTNDAVDERTNLTDFESLGLSPRLLNTLRKQGLTTPTPIQTQAIPHVLDGRDLMGLAQTGTGKTAAFGLPLVHMQMKRGTRPEPKTATTLILAPTRELAAQVAENFVIYSKYVKLTKALLIGGVSFKEQDTLIDKGVDVLIATPGRLLDHFERGKLILSDVKIMVIDEADRMLDMGFIPDIERIFSLTPFTRQTLFFSATMPPEIERLTNTFLANPAKVEVARQSTTSETITQGLVMFRGSRKDREASEKRKLLRDLIASEGEACRNAIIFCNRKVDVDIVAKSMKKYGLNASPIHGDLDQSHRMRTLDGFRSGEITFLIASDVAARGRDIPDVSHVFNFDVPSHAEDYVHRIGRTGRAGKLGTALTICARRDEKYLAEIEKLLGNPIPKLEGHGTGATARRRRAEPRPRPKTAPSAVAVDADAKAKKIPRQRPRQTRWRHSPRPNPPAQNVAQNATVTAQIGASAPVDAVAAPETDAAAARKSSGWAITCRTLSR